MTEQQFLDECDRVLAAIEDAIVTCDADVDIDTQRSGSVLEVEFENGSKIIVNGNAPVREIWVAARSGGYHFRHGAGGWVDTRSGEPLAACLTRVFREQCGVPVAFDAV